MSETENPYSAPKAELRETPAAARSPILAVITGIAVDTAGTFVSGIALTFGHAVWMIHSGATTDGVAALAPTPALRAASIVVGTLWSVLGGYVGARMAKRRELALGAIQGTLSMAIGFWLGSHAEPLNDLLLSTATIAATVAGSALGRRTNLRRR